MLIIMVDPLAEAFAEERVYKPVRVDLRATRAIYRCPSAT